jgi:hypothetical protein
MGQSTLLELVVAAFKKESVKIASTQTAKESKAKAHHAAYGKDFISSNAVLLGQRFGIQGRFKGLIEAQTMHPMSPVVGDENLYGGVSTLPSSERNAVHEHRKPCGRNFHGY